MSEYPTVDERKCNGSGDCVAACPVNCLEMKNGLPWMPRPLDCVSCTVCAIVCPTEAITMRQDGMGMVADLQASGEPET